MEKINDPKLIKDLKTFTVDSIKNIEHDCNNNDISWQNISISADGIIGSLGYHMWEPPTDSSFVIYPMKPFCKKTYASIDLDDNTFKITHGVIIDNFIKLLENNNRNDIDAFSLVSYIYLDKIWRQKVEFKVFNVDREELFSHEYNKGNDPIIEIM